MKITNEAYNSIYYGVIKPQSLHQDSNLDKKRLQRSA